MIATEVKYKKTDVEWLPEIPAHWKTIRLRFLCSITTGKKNTEDRIEHGEYPFFVRSQTIERINSYSFEGEGILTAGDGVGVGKVFHYVNEKFDFHQRVYLLYDFTEEINGKFLFYYLQTFLITELMRYNSKSTVDSIRLPILKDFIIPIPPKTEQSNSVIYIDEQTDKITRFIQTKQRFIELLKEQRQSIITQAVTKGINDSVKMRETVLGEIPEHWEVRRLKFLADVRFSTVDKHSHKEEKQVRLCNYVDVYKHEYITNDFDFMIATATDAEIKRFTVEKGDVIITKDSETANDIAVPALVVEDLENVVCAYHLAHIKPNRELIESEFLFRLFQSKKINSHFEVAAKGVTRHGLSYDDINSVFLPYPTTLDEQQKIIQHIKTETSTLDIAISKAEREIELIKEYREAMIAEAVTGKMKL